MKTGALILSLAFIPAVLQAQEVSYSNLSKYMLNNAYVQSPVYTKKMFRAIRETDTYNYETQLNELETLKNNREISTREYNEKKAQLQQEFNKIYAHQNPAAQATTIRTSPVQSFYYGAMEPGERLRLMALSSQELTDAERGIPTIQPLVATPTQITKQSVPTRPTARRRSISHLQNGVSNERGNEDNVVSVPQIQIQKKRTLGRKSIPVKIGAF